MALISKGGGGGGGGGAGPQATAGRAAPLTNLPPRTAPVCGRKAEMQAVAEFFNEAQREARPGVVEIVGRRGIGATTVAVELARRVGGRFPGGAWYLPLSMGKDLAWAELGVARGIPRSSDLAASAAAARDAVFTGPKALVVLDGALSKEDLEASLPPPGAGSSDAFIVSEEASGLVENVVEVSDVPEHASRRIAHAVFRMRDGGETDPPAVRSRDGLAITASLAARAAVAFDGKQGPVASDNTTASVMRLIPMVAQNPVALELLLVCAFAHPVRIPVDVLFCSVGALRDGRGETPEPEAVGNGVLWLARLGLVMPDDEHRVSMHPMVQEIARGMAQTDADRNIALNALALGLVEEATASLNGGDGVDLQRAALHQLRNVVPELSGDAHTVASKVLADVEAALSVPSQS